MENNKVEITTKITEAQIRKAIKEYFDFPNDAKISFHLKTISYKDRMGYGDSHEEFSHAQAVFHKELNEVLKKNCKQKAKKQG